MSCLRLRFHSQIYNVIVLIFNVLECIIFAQML
jgi:hypothetical protein